MWLARWLITHSPHYIVKFFCGSLHHDLRCDAIHLFIQESNIINGFGVANDWPLTNFPSNQACVLKLGLAALHSDSFLVKYDLCGELGRISVQCAFKDKPGLPQWDRV